jgi:uncharacterized damage-inducible protein DinB
VKRTKWSERTFPAIQDNGLIPCIIERLDGTPARLTEIISKTNPDLFRIKSNGKWSIKENIGHLSDLEPLWIGRVEDITNDLAELRPADLTNQKTHNETDINILLQHFRDQREIFVTKLRNLADEQLLKSALHLLSKTQKRIIDLTYFVAEHDDHHLAHISEILSETKAQH